MSPLEHIRELKLMVKRDQLQGAINSRNERKANTYRRQGLRIKKK